MKIFSIFFIFITLFFKTFASETTPKEDGEIEKMSEALGHLLGEKLQKIDLNIDIQKIIKGMQESKIGNPSPLSKKECFDIIKKIKQKNFEKKQEENLIAANNFLKENAKDKKIFVLVEKELQYQVLKKGSGKKVQKENTPLIRLKGYFLDKTIFCMNKKILASFDELIPGLQKSIVGMKEKEIRKIFIHPNLGYKNLLSNPNSLLIFEVEILKVDKKDLDKIPLKKDDFKDKNLIAEKKIR
jgi:FKBP-type peptidyl-prolyl cis-trans isomerase